MSVHGFLRSVHTVLRTVRLTVQRAAGVVLCGPVLVIGVLAADAVIVPDSATVAADSADARGFFGLPAPAVLQDAAPGEPLATREVPVALGARAAGPVLTLPLTATQVQYRTTDAQGRPTAAVTTVLRPPGGGNGTAVMYASYYDSLDPADSPSRAIAGMPVADASTISGELALVAPLLASGTTVILPDIQGERGIFAVGEEYGHITLDALRATARTSGSGYTGQTPTVLAGYSGGAIAAAWAGSLAADYAPEVASSIVGVAQGGLMVTPEHNLDYVAESPTWSAVAGMAFLGMARAYGVDLDPYLTAHGRQVLGGLDGVIIGDAKHRFDHLRWDELFRPEFPGPDSVPAIRRILDATDLSRRPAPDYPQLIVQGTGGVEDGTPDSPTLGGGDGVMLTRDVRGWARRLCGAGAPVDYREVGAAHGPAGGQWAREAATWIRDALSGAAVSDNTCENI
ncbi:lipase family protein [Corynebacterium nuruki]|uniref:lipase family protein n=1 Tax=Corynebacterium nuruki TaxID=1032851 RepID=UPI0002487B6A|nr:lipase family protein [Corynebacterium nuruki]